MSKFKHLFICVRIISGSFFGGEGELYVYFCQIIKPDIYVLARLALPPLCFCFNVARIYQSFLLLHLDLGSQKTFPYVQVLEGFH